MKKFLLILLTVMLCFTFIACEDQQPKPTKYEVKYMNGTDQVGTTAEVEAGEITLAAAPTAVTGKVFTGWKDDTTAGTITEAGAKYTVSKAVTFTAQWEDLTLVANGADLMAAFNDGKKYVRLSADIEALAGTDQLTISSETKEIAATLDLAGFSIKTELYVRGNKGGTTTAYTNDLTLKITNTASTESKIGLEGKDYYGILAYGIGNLDLTIEKVTVGGDYGIYTNGSPQYVGSKITAKDVKFVSKLGPAAYLASNFTYNFENCTFTGLSGYYTKSGTHTLTNCTLTATATTHVAPEYNGNGANETGSALMIDSAKGYIQTLNVTINGGKLESAAGYAIEEMLTAPTVAEQIKYHVVTLGTGDKAPELVSTKEPKHLEANLPN